MKVNSHFKAVLRLTYDTYIPEYTAQLLAKHSSGYNRNTTEGTQRKEKPPGSCLVFQYTRTKIYKECKACGHNRERSR